MESSHFDPSAVPDFTPLTGSSVESILVVEKDTKISRLNRRVREFGWKKAAGVAAGVAALGGGMVTVNAMDSAERPTVVSDFYVQDSGCEDFADFDAASDSIYNEDAFLPPYEVTDYSTVAGDYVAALFDENGPLSNDGDFMSLAAFMAAVGSPANDAEAVDPNYNYGREFRAKINRYQKAGGLEIARADCKIAQETATQTAQYENDWARNGEQVTILRALRDNGNAITGFMAEHFVTQENMSGVVFKLRFTSADLDGFADVMVMPDGTMFVKGITTGEGVRVVIDSPVLVSPTDTSPTTIDMATTTSSTATTVAEAATSSSRSGQDTPTTSRGPAGTTPTTGPVGTTPTTGPVGTTPTSGPGGPGEGPGPGGPGGPGEEEPETTTTTPATTTTTPTTTSTTTTTVPTTTTTTVPATPTTTGPVKPGIVVCDPNIDDCEAN